MICVACGFEPSMDFGADYAMKWLRLKGGFLCPNCLEKIPLGGRVSLGHGWYLERTERYDHKDGCNCHYCNPA